MVLPLFAGVLHATSIGIASRGELQSAAQFAGAGMDRETTMPPVANEDQPAPRIEVSAQTVNQGCVFISDCFKRVPVPEPTSLMLFGSGLLSVAGLIRRRLLR